MKGAIVAVVASLASSACAFPAFAKDPQAAERLAFANNYLKSRNLPYLSIEEKFPQLAGRSLNEKREQALSISAAEGNCGPSPCLVFNEEDQYVSTSGENAYQSPGPGDIRGPCPGLNVASNYGYLPRNGIASIEETISGLGKMYNLEAELAAALAAYAVALDGNIVEGVWSIGGPLPTDYLTGALLGTGQGLSWSHNNYEGDGSIGRADSYLNGGDAHSLNVTKFELTYATGQPDDRYTIDKFRQRHQTAIGQAIAENPYYFTGAFSTIVVVPAAYNFVINFMSNHSAEEPEGYLTGDQFKSWFAVSGEPGNFKWNRGQEKVPTPWYRRPSTAQYGLADTIGDVLIGYLAYPDSLRIGGNVGKVNTFTGIDPSDLSGGVFNASNLFEGNNFACFSFSILAQAIPNFLDNILNDLSPVTDLINKYFGPYVGGLSCPQQGKYQTGLFDHFPGYTYRPKGPATNY